MSILEWLAAGCFTILALWSLLSWARRKQTIIHARHNAMNPGMTRVETDYYNRFPYEQ